MYELNDLDREEIATLLDAADDDYVGAVMEWLTSDPTEADDAIFRSPELWGRTLDAINEVWQAWRDRPQAAPVNVGPDALQTVTVADLVALSRDPDAYDNAVFYWLMGRNADTDAVFTDDRVIDATYNALRRIRATRAAQLESPPPRYVNDAQWAHRTQRTMERASAARRELKRQVGLAREARRRVKAVSSPRQQAMRLLADAHPQAFITARRAVMSKASPAEVRRRIREEHPET